MIAERYFANVYHLDDGLLFQREFDSVFEAEAFVQGFEECLQQFGLNDARIWTCVYDEPAEEEA